MTIPDEARSRAAETFTSEPSTRVARPVLEREGPIRNWSTLFGPGWSATGTAENERARAWGSTDAASSGPAASVASFTAQTLSDAVGQGYRVINEYLAQGQRYAEAMRFPDWTNFMQGSAAANPNASFSSPEMQQLFRRVTQYGWDFAGLYFEMWSRMGWPPPSAPPGPFPPPSDAARGVPVATPPEHAAPVEDGEPARVFVCITSERRTESMLELRRGRRGALIVHALRSEGHEAPAIRGVTIEARQDDGSVRVAVEVPSNQPPGVYNGMIVDPVSNLPRGTLTVKVLESAGERTP